MVLVVMLHTCTSISFREHVAEQAVQDEAPVVGLYVLPAVQLVHVEAPARE